MRWAPGEDSVWTAPYYQSPSSAADRMKAVYTSDYVITVDEMPGFSWASIIVREAEADRIHAGIEIRGIRGLLVSFAFGKDQLDD